MALTVPQLEAHLGRFLRTLGEGLTTPRQLEHLEAAMRLILPGGRRYVESGTLGTRPERLEAMTTLRDAIFQRLTGQDPQGDAAAAHRLTAHWVPHLDEESP